MIRWNLYYVLQGSFLTKADSIQWPSTADMVLEAGTGRATRTHSRVDIAGVVEAATPIADTGIMKALVLDMEHQMVAMVARLVDMAVGSIR